MAWRWLLLAAMLHPAFAAGPQKWLRVKSERFEVLTSDSERRAKDLLLEFERVQGFFEQSMGRAVRPDVPLRIVLFKNEKEFQEYRPGEVAAAYYLPGADADYIVMHNSGGGRIAIHEFVLLLVKHSYRKQLPVWLNEGFAELYSTMKLVGNKVQVGALIESHMYIFNSERPIPLANLLPPATVRSFTTASAMRACSTHKAGR